MNKLRTAYFGLIVVALGLVSCGNSDEHKVDDKFTEYIQRFQDEATKHGKNLDLINGGLIVEFADLKDGVAGLCHYEKPIRIEIDKTYWDAISKYADADLMKENLLFHELGHGFLGRKHLNSTLENGDWKSIMCGGDKVNGRSWNINYHGVRRAYYVDELFNESTAAPTYSSLQLVADTIGYSTVHNLNFNSQSQSGWQIKDTVSYSTSLTTDGKLKFQSKIAQAYLVSLTTPAISTNFSYELTIENSAGNATDQYGIIFGNIPADKNGNNSPIEYFNINNSKKMFMGNRTYYSFFTELDQSKIVPAGKNKLKVFKIGGMIYYFINNSYVYCSEIVTTDGLNKFGFMVPAQGMVLVDNFIIAQPRISGAPTRLKQSQPLQFEITPIGSTTQNSVLNQ